MAAIIRQLVEKYGEDEFNWFIPECPAAFEQQLRKELRPGHPLQRKSKQLMCAAKNERNDDVLFWDGTEYYLVHLTWNGNADIRHPIFAVIKSVEAFLTQDFLKN